MVVSVIIPCYNQGVFLADAIESVLEQTYYSDTRVEIIVVDDGSTDCTNEVANSYPVTLAMQSNQGVSVARNRGIMLSSGSFILPLDADDKLHPRFLERTVPILFQLSSVGIVYTHRRHFGLINTTKYAAPFDLESLKQKCSLNYCSLYRRTVWEECGGYNPQMRAGYEDWDFWLKAAETSWKFHLVDGVLFFYRKHGRTLSSIAKENHVVLYEVLRNNHPKLFEI